MARLPGPILRTERVILQTPRLRDVPAIYRATTDVAVTRHMSWAAPTGPKDTAEFVRQARRDQRRGVALTYVLHDAAMRRPIGCCGAHHIDTAEHRKAEIGYWLARSHWGRGLAGEATSALIAHLFTRLDLHRLYAMTFVQNAASARLLARLGFRHEGTLRHHIYKQGRAHDVHVYGLLVTDPAARRILKAVG